MSRIIHILLSFVLLIMVEIFFSLPLFAQTFSIPDVNFREKLKSSYPSVMLGDELNISVAKVFTLDLILTNSNISDLSGIEYFESIYKLDVSQNNLTSLPNLSSLNNIKFLYVNSNNLSSLPDFSGLESLLQLHVHSNFLTSIPASISTLTQLQQLIINNNRLTALPDLSSLVQLDYFLMSNNQISVIPNLNQLSNLQVLHCDNNLISDLNGLEQASTLNTLYCFNNRIHSLAVLNDLTTVKKIWAFNNLLSELPNLSNKPQLTEIEVHNNFLTIDDLIPLTYLSGLTNFRYHPQASIVNPSSQFTRVLDTITLTYSAVDISTGILYRHFHNATFKIETNSPLLRLESIQYSDSGTYFMEASHPSLPLLKLVYASIKLNVEACMELITWEIDLGSVSCERGYHLSKNQVQLLDAVSPISYSIMNPYDTILWDTKVSSDLRPGKYTIRIKDADGCSIDTSIILNQFNDCDVILHLNSIYNTYYIDVKGSVKILDNTGNTILEVEGPYLWDGSTSSGKITQPGYYVILVNNKKWKNITVVQ